MPAFLTTGVVLAGILYVGAGLGVAVNVLMAWLVSGCAYYALQDLGEALAILAFAIPLEEAFSAWGAGRYNTLTYVVLVILGIRLLKTKPLRRLAPVEVLLFMWFGWRVLSLLWTRVGLTTGVADLVTYVGGCAVVYAYARMPTPRVLARSAWCFLAGSAVMVLMVASFYDASGGLVWAGTRYELSMLGGNTGISGPRIARMAAAAALVAVALLRAYGRGLKAYLLRASVAFFGLMILLTLNRTSILALALALVTWAVLDDRLSGRMRRLALLGLVTVGAWNAAWLINPDVMRFRLLQTVESYRAGDQARLTSGRTRIWAAAVPVFVDHPIKGVGVGSFGPALGIDRITGELRGAHSGYVQEFVEGGVVGGGLFVAMLGLFGWLALTRTGPMRSVAAAMCMLLILTLGAQSLGRAKDSWFTLGLVLFWVRQQAQRPRCRPRGAGTRRGARREAEVRGP